MQSFADLSRQHRLSAGLTQEALADRARMSLAAIGALERGACQRPYRSTIALLAEALSLPAEDRIEMERAAQRVRELPKSNDVALRNLPVYLSSFIGREPDLESVVTLLENYRHVTLVGIAGVGKTRLAIRAAEEFSNRSTSHHVDSIRFVDLSPLKDAESVVAAIASCVGMLQCRTLEDLLRHLRAQRFFLTLDNCEHIVHDVAEITRELLRHCAQGQILATSRQPLVVEGESVYRVFPLANVDAMRLFVDRAEAADNRFMLSASTAPSVVEICRRLDGLPLAIELVAARTSSFPLAVIAERLEEFFVNFSRGPNSTSRHKTMDAAFDWSYDLLDELERSMFQRLSAFVSGFTFELATSIWEGETEAQVAAILSSLVEKSLIQYHIRPEPTRYRMLEPARARSSGTGATRCGFGSGEIQKWVRLALETCTGATPPQIRAKLELMASGNATVFAVDPKVMLAACERALFFQESRDLRAIATAKYFLGHALRIEARLNEAETMLCESRASARACGAQSVFALATQALATVRFDRGDLDGAHELLSETLSLERATGADRQAANAAVTLAEVEFAIGNAEKAVQLSEESASYFRTRADFINLAWSLNSVSAYLVANGRCGEARSTAREALRGARAVGRTRMFGWALQHLVAAALLDKDRIVETKEITSAAKLIGYVDALCDGGTVPRDRTERQEYEKILAVLNAAFPEPELTKLVRDGKEWSEDEAYVRH